MHRITLFNTISVKPSGVVILGGQLLKSTAVVSAMTIISRLLGFVRDMILARFFGAGEATDAFFVAFKIPNIGRRLFAEGAFAQAFVPVLSEYKEAGDRASLKGFVDRTAGAMAVVMVALTVLGVLAAPLWVLLFAPGFYGQGDRYALTVQMLQITFPYLFFISFTAFAGGILNTFGKFAVPAFTPVLLNICMIAAAIGLAPLMPEPVTALAWGVLVAGLLQLAFQIPALMRLGLLPRPRLGFADAGVYKIARLMLPALFGVSVTQINLLLDTLVASFLAAGSVSWLYYSERLVEFPLGVFGIALATVILPNLSASHAGKNGAAFSAALDWGLRWVVLLGAPATLGLMLLAQPILATLFQYDEFRSLDAQMASHSLMAYALGLLAFVLIKILVPGFSARQDMRTPVRFGVYGILANLLLNLVLMGPLAHAGLALATSLAAFINAALLLGGLLRENVYNPRPGWPGFLARIVLANSVMGAALFFAAPEDGWAAWSAAERLGQLALLIVVGVAAYALSLWLSGLRPSHLALADEPA